MATTDIQKNQTVQFVLDAFTQKPPLTKSQSLLPQTVERSASAIVQNSRDPDSGTRKDIVKESEKRGKTSSFIKQSSNGSGKENAKENAKGFGKEFNRRGKSSSVIRPSTSADIFPVAKSRFASLWQDSVAHMVANKAYKIPTAPIVNFNGGKTGNALQFSKNTVDTSQALDVGQLSPPGQVDITHHSIELFFDDAIQAARSAIDNPRAAIRVFVECKTENQQDWTKIYGGLSKSYTYAGLQADKDYIIR